MVKAEPLIKRTLGKLRVYIVLDLEPAYRRVYDLLFYNLRKKNKYENSKQNQIIRKKNWKL